MLSSWLKNPALSLSKYRYKLYFNDIKSAIKQISRKGFDVAGLDQYHKKLIESVQPLNIFLLFKMGFYFGFFLGVIFGLYLAKIIAILICDLKLPLMKLILISLGTLFGVAGIIFSSAVLGSLVGWLLDKYLNRHDHAILNFKKNSRKQLGIIKLKSYHRRLKKGFQNKKTKSFKSAACFQIK